MLLTWRGRVAAASAIALAASSAASGRTVRTGEAARFQRGSSVRDFPTIVWSSGGRDVRLVALTGRLVPRARYELLDENGPLGYVITPEIETDRSCRTFTYDSARAPLQGARSPSIPSRGDVVMVGPTEPRFSARVVHPTASDAPPRGLRDLAGAVDLDGDRRADVARYVYVCKGTYPPTSSGGSNTCVEIWARDGATWILIDEGDFPPCQ